MSIKKNIKQGPRFLPTSQAPLKEAHETLGGDAFDRGDLVARECKYDEKLGIYGEWKYIFENDMNESKSYQFNLKRGGLIKLERQVIPNEQLFQIRTEMEEEVKYNQYPFRAAFVEPRLHALYSNNPANGYMYHGVKMKSRPLAELHHISQLATTLADRFRTSEFNIGLDLVVYRNGKDSIGWHADNTQGEQIIASLLIDSPCPARTICIKPNNIPRDGDEAIELYPTSGDMYQMDAKMQEGYLHSIPRATTETKRRMVIVFRHGQPKKVDSDLGVQIKSLLPPTDRRVHYKFGTLSELTEGHLYSRQILLKTGAHCADRKGVSGNAKEGCNAVIVTKSDWSKREIDTFHDVTYHTDSSMQGSLALERSFHTQKEIRLFRSTKNKSSKFAPTLSKSSPVACYRYDGLYLVAQFTTMDATSGQLFLLKRKSASAVENGLPRQQSMSSEVLSELTTRLKLVQSYIAHNSFWSSPSPHHSSVHSSLDKNKKDNPLSALKYNLSNTISSDSCVGETKATMRQSFIPDRPVQQSSLQIQKSSASSASRNNQTNKSIAEIIPKSIPYQQTLLSESQSCLSAKASAEQVDIKEEQRLRAEYEKATLVKRRGKQRKKRRPKHRREFFNGSIILIREKSAFQREWIDTRRLRL